MAEPAKDHDYSWDDYRSWDDDRRWEIVGGEAYAMSPSPMFRHQKISTALLAELARYFGSDKRKCELLHAPMDVKLSSADIVQPDILVVCDPNRIKVTHIEGPPTLTIEILSPSSVSHDRLTKMRLYARYGVQEYWIVTPYPHLAEVFSLDGDSYRVAGVFGRKDTLVSPHFDGLEVVLEDVFDFPISPEEFVNEIRESTPPYKTERSDQAQTARGQERTDEIDHGDTETRRHGERQ